MDSRTRTVRDEGVVIPLQMLASDDAARTSALTVSVAGLLNPRLPGWRDRGDVQLPVVEYGRTHNVVYYRRSLLSDPKSALYAADSATTSGGWLPVSYIGHGSPASWNWLTGRVPLVAAALLEPSAFQIDTGEQTEPRSLPAAPWWESQLPKLHTQLVAYVRKRLPTRHADQEDLVSATFLAFCEHIRRRPEAFPSSWFEELEPESDQDRLYLHQLLSTILRRRIADLLRSETRAWVLPRTQDPDVCASAEESDPEKRALFVALLTLVLKALTDLNQNDRELLALVSGTSGRFEKALGSRDRQRLKRLRAKLARQVRTHFGRHIADLIEE